MTAFVAGATGLTGRFVVETLRRPQILEHAVRNEGVLVNVDSAGGPGHQEAHLAFFLAPP